jgi:hypothetical protein
MLLEYVRVLHFWLRFCGSAKHFYVTLFKKSIWFTNVQESVAQRIGMIITDLASLPGSCSLLLLTFMVHRFFVQDYDLLHI